jgi:hypothetical protein
VAIYTKTLSTLLQLTQLAGHYIYTAYTTVNFVEGYLHNHLDTSAWDNATLADKERALIQATEIVERLNYVGEKTVETQALFFPRKDDTTVPVAVQRACGEIALALLDGVDPELEYHNLLMTSQTFGGIRTTYDRKQYQEHTIHGVPSIVAWFYLKPYLRDSRQVILDRV